MASTTSRGNRYKKRTQAYYEALGYTVQLTEFQTARMIPGRVLFVKKDVFGSDGISMNGEEIIFWNSKHVTNPDTSTYSAEVSKGKKEFRKYPFPKSVKLQLVMWEPYKKPVIIDVEH